MGTDNLAIRECGTKFLLIVHFLLQFAIILGSMGAIAIMFILRPLPTVPGWAIVAVDALTAATGTFALFFVGRFGLFGIHLLCHALSMAGLLSFSLVVLLRPTMAIQLLQPVGSQATAQHLVVTEGSLMASLLGLQLKSLLLVAIMQWCEGDKLTGDVEAGTIGEVKVVEVLPTIEESGEGEGAEEEKSTPRSRQQQLASEMRAKYGLKAKEGVRKKRWLVMGANDRVSQVE